MPEIHTTEEPFGQLLLDKELCVQYVNKAFSTYTNIPKEALLNCDIKKCFDFSLKSQKKLSKPKENLQKKFGILRLVAYYGSDSTRNSLRFRFNLSLYKQDADRDICYQLVMVKAEKLDNPFRPEVSDSHLFQLLLKDFTDSIYFKDIKGRIFLTNQLHAKKFGYSYFDFMGKTDFDLFTEEHAQKAWDDEQNIIKNGKPISTEEKETHKNGRITWASTTKMPLFNEESNIVGTYGISKDITPIKEVELELRKTKQMLEEVNAAKDKFFSIIAHDLRSPFNAILGFAEVFHEMMQNEEYKDALRYAEMVHQSAEQTYALMNNLLDWANSQSKRMKFNPIEIQIKNLCDEVISGIDHVAQSKKINIHNEIPAQITLIGDYNMIETILRNLISNAIKYSYPDSEIRILFSEDEHQSCLSVRDQGTGIDEKKIPQLFEIDSNIQTEGTRNEKGTGLGLIVSKEFTERHGGRIFAESIKGAGSTFCFTIPKKY